MTDLLYRIPGMPSTRAVQYLRACKNAGWREEQLEQLELDIPKFESASLNHPFESALKAMVVQPNELHLPFLQELYEHIRILASSECDEDLLRRANGQSKDSIEAHRLRLQINGQIGGEVNDADAPASGDVHFHVKEQKNEVQVTRGKSSGSAKQSAA